MAVHPLAELIEDVLKMSDPPLSQRQLAKRSGISPSRVRELLNNEMKNMPDPDTLRGLSRGLRVPLRIVVEKALDSLGLPSGGDGPLDASDTVGQMRRIVENSVALTPQDRDYWRALIDALERRQQRLKGGSQGAL